MHIRLTRGKNKFTATAIRTVYDKEKGRGVQIVLGSFSPYAAEINDADLPMATADEFDQAVAWLAEKKAEREISKKAYLPRDLISSATSLTKAIEDGDDVVWVSCSPNALQAAIEALSAAMRKARVWSPTRKAVRLVEPPLSVGFSHDPNQVLLPGFGENKT